MVNSGSLLLGQDEHKSFLIPNTYELRWQLIRYFIEEIGWSVIGLNLCRGLLKTDLNNHFLGGNNLCSIVYEAHNNWKCKEFLYDCFFVTNSTCSGGQVSKYNYIQTKRNFAIGVAR